MCVCVCVRERERERKTNLHGKIRDKKIQVKNFKFIYLRTYFLGGLASSGQTVGSLLRTHRPVKLAGNSIAPNINFWYICKHIFCQWFQHLNFTFFMAKLFSDYRSKSFSWGLYYKTLQIRNLRENDEFYSRLASSGLVKYSNLDKQTH